MPAYNPDLSLTDNLSAHGLDHAHSGNGIHDIVDVSGHFLGMVVFTGRYEAVVSWLKACRNISCSNEGDRSRCGCPFSSTKY